MKNTIENTILSMASLLLGGILLLIPMLLIVGVMEIINALLF